MSLSNIINSAIDSVFSGTLPSNPSDYSNVPPGKLAYFDCKPCLKSVIV